MTTPIEKTEERRLRRNAQTRARRAKDPEKVKAARAKWRKANAERLREYFRARYASDPERFCNQQRERRARDPEKTKLLDAKYAAARKDKARIYNREWRAKNKESARDRHRRWRSANIEKARTSCRNRRARKRQADGHHSEADAINIRKLQRDRCAYCKTRLHNSGELDHIIPLSKGGTNWPRNLQWLCQPCNSSKHARDPIEFSRANGLLC